MKSSYLLIIAIIVILFGAGFFVLSQKTSPEQNLNPTNDSLITSPDNTETSQTKYIIYSPEALKNAADSRRVLFFYASWCPTCRPADVNFTENAAKIPEDVVVFRVNYNDTDTDADEKALAAKYNVTYQHTFVQIDSEGNEITKWNGGQLEELLKNIK